MCFDYNKDDKCVNTPISIGKAFKAAREAGL
ncbi:hypothetical protein HDE69_002394 [Pedobacter cryoconitis]|uniref:Uncharacterized protein n=1 Tax=Pedobacter cryoconitis TaxID=188932 RepID=A0A7W8YT55_9SPHI|nr:hypothetical protein [Pedobacter cryoconitis]MBB5649081.1 hypothetical protein [Pedobacter cryoconitis]